MTVSLDQKQRQLAELMSAAIVLPVVTVDDPRHAIELARALHRGGLSTIELTLRSDKALECLEAIAGKVPEIVAGAGTVITPADVKSCEAAGARFMVSPGASGELLDAAGESPLPLLPGATTASEIMQLGERGYRHLKFFPAGQSGGPDWLKAISGPLPQYRFCPTGGVTIQNAGDWLALSNVVCVGGSWIAPGKLVEAGKFGEIEDNAREAARLGSE